MVSVAVLLVWNVPLLITLRPLFYVISRCLYFLYFSVYIHCIFLCFIVCFLCFSTFFIVCLPSCWINAIITWKVCETGHHRKSNIGFWLVPKLAILKYFERCNGRYNAFYHVKLVEARLTVYTVCNKNVAVFWQHMVYLIFAKAT